MNSHLMTEEFSSALQSNINTVNLRKEFLDFIDAKKLILDGERTLLAVSGGVDSCVMAHLFASSDFDFGIVHCNFDLRGNESDGDENFVKDLATRTGHPYYSKRFDTKNFSEINHLSIQQAARQLRYDFFHEIASENNFKKIATAHHFDDSIETYFINLSRNSGSKGLRGIPVAHGKIIRPLLFAGRDDILYYARQHQISFRNDSSNETDDYERNRIRHHLIPKLSKENPDFSAEMKAKMDFHAGKYDRWEEALNMWKSKYVRTDTSGVIEINRKEISSQNDPVSFLADLLYSFAITGAECEKILSASTGRQFFYSGYEILVDRDQILLKKKTEGKIAELLIDDIPFEFCLGRKLISMTGIEKNNDTATGPEGSQMKIDAAKATPPLLLRKWTTGDRFRPLGMSGTKKVSDFLIDRKLSRFEKNSTLVLLSGKDIVCILGHQIDDRFKVTASTKQILLIEIKDT